MSADATVDFDVCGPLPDATTVLEAQVWIGYVAVTLSCFVAMHLTTRRAGQARTALARSAR